LSEDAATVEVEVEDEAWLQALPDAQQIVRRAALAALAADEDGAGAEVTVLLTDDAEIQALNAQFRRKDRPTNVLSFPAPAFARPHLGDVALASGVCRREVDEQGKTLSDHLAHLTVHGVLHLLGYDHEAEAEAEAMEEMERVILNDLGVADPYARDADA
jgi:probable rRNA maturation factor